MIQLFLILFSISVFSAHAKCQAGYYPVSVVGKEGTYCTEAPPCSGPWLDDHLPTNECPGINFLNTDGEGPLENGACCAVINTKQQVGCVARSYHGVRCLSTSNGSGVGGVSGSGIAGTGAGTDNDDAGTDDGAVTGGSADGVGGAVTGTDDGAGAGASGTGVGGTGAGVSGSGADGGDGTDGGVGGTGSTGVGGTDGTGVGGTDGTSAGTDGGDGTGTDGTGTDETGTGGTGTGTDGTSTDTVGDDSGLVTDPTNDSGDGLSASAISGIVVGALILVAVIVALFVSRNRSSSVPEDTESNAFEYEDTTLEEGRLSTQVYEVLTPSPDNYESYPSKAVNVILYDPEINHVKNVTLYEPKVKNITLYEPEALSAEEVTTSASVTGTNSGEGGHPYRSSSFLKAR